MRNMDRALTPMGPSVLWALPRSPLQNPIPLYSGFAHSLQTSLYWAREGGKPVVLSSQMDFCQMLWARYREVAEQHGRTIPVGEEAAWGGYLVLADTQAQGEAWAHDCLWFWDTWSLPFGQGHPPGRSAMLIPSRG